MKKHLRRYAVSAAALGVIVGGAVVGLPGSEPSWQPTTYGLTQTPAQLLPANVSSANPVRVVSTTLDTAGRPVVTVHTATDQTTAQSLVKAAQKAKNALGVEVDATVTAIGVPTGTDPARTQQWDLTKIRATDAWQKSTGAGVVVAVIDTGVDASHADLAGQVLAGYDAIADTAGVSTDGNGHGTHVAGTIAAATGNGIGVSAIAPDTKILPIKVLGANGSGYMSDTAEGIVWAADHGANVINMSLGSSSKVSAVSNAIAYARSKGVTVVAAAGNEREDGSPTSYPAADAGVIAVAATDSADKVAYYSNQGSYVDVAAPGSAILSTYPGNKYSTMYGTSMASPHVAAVAALLKAYHKALTPDQVEAALESSAVDLGTAGKDTDYGYGRIDAVAALAAVTAPATTAPTSSATTAPTTTAPTTTVPTTAVPTPSATKPSSATPTPTTSVSPTPTKTASPSPTATPTKTATPTPTRTTTAPKVRPSISVAASAPNVVFGSATAVTYTVTLSNKAFANQPVQIGVAEGNGAFVFTAATTDATGRVTVRRAATAKFQVKMVIEETATSLAVTSPTTVFSVVSKVAVASQSTGNLTVTLTGAAGQTVQVQRYDRNRWVLASTYTAEPTWTLTGLTKGQSYRVVVLNTATVTGVVSGTVRVG
ncbi:S8 family peptidase [Micromonosporaceae bacterium Da 78-11]